MGEIAVIAFLATIHARWDRTELVVYDPVELFPSHATDSDGPGLGDAAGFAYFYGLFRCTQSRLPLHSSHRRLSQLQILLRQVQMALGGQQGGVLPGYVC